MWVVVAALTGVALRFVPMPKNLLPALVGVAVTIAVVLLLLFGQSTRDEAHRALPLAPKPPSKPPTPGRPKSDVGTRLNALTRRPNRSGRRELRGS
jgi:hypothetical protein